MFNWFKGSTTKATDVFSTSNETVDLLVIREKYNAYTPLFFTNYGLNITKYYSNLNDLEIDILTSTNKVRILIIEEGLGDFITIQNRKNINSLLGAIDGVDKKALIFYINSALITDNKTHKGVTFKKFKSTQHIIEYLLKLGEPYTQSDGYKEVSKKDRVVQALQYRGKSKVGLDECNRGVFQIIDIDSLMDGNNTSLESFEVDY